MNATLPIDSHQYPMYLECEIAVSQVVFGTNFGEEGFC